MERKFKKRIKFSSKFNITEKIINQYNLNTICHNARCPNISECFAHNKLTFMILGDVCTRNCKFCNVKSGKPSPIDKDEPNRIVEIIKKLKIKYVIITSVTRDDLQDYGVGHYINTVKMIKDNLPDVVVEILIPDFMGKSKYIKKIAYSGADVISHNIETIERLYSTVRPMADFTRSISVLTQIKKFNNKIKTKSGFMVGLGEKEEEIKHLLHILYESKVDGVTIGQYFQPSKKNMKVLKYWEDGDFKKFDNWAKEIGFSYVVSDRFARSSTLEII